MSVKNYGVISSIKELETLVDKIIAEGKPFGFDIETGYDGPDKPNAQFHPEEGFITGISFTNSLEWARYVPLRHDYCEQNLDNYEAARVFWKLLSSGLGIAHNAKFEISFLIKWFKQYLKLDDINDAYFKVFSDTMLEAYVLGTFMTVGLKDLVSWIFDHKMTRFEDLFPGSKTKATARRFNVLELTDIVVSYACEDSLWCLALHEHFYPQVKDSFIYKLEMEILPILCEMEDFGLKLDWKFLSDAAMKARDFKEALYQEIMSDLSEALGRPVAINLGSPDQVRDMLYTQLKFTTTRVTKTSKDTDSPKLSTDSIALERLSREHAVVKKILQWREISKLIGSYLEKFEKDFSYDLEREMVHPRHKQATVITGRFSVAEPNYQQLPKKYHYALDSGLEYDLRFRDAVVAPDGYYIAGFDFSQIELRVMAGESGEPAWLEAFAEGVDIHARTASIILGKPEDTLTEEEREKYGKLFNFAIGYGLGVHTLAERLAISEEEAQAIYDGYFDAVPTLREYIREQERKGRRDGFVTTKFGRKMTVWEYQSPNRYVRDKGDRASLNYQIQGAGTGDLPKMVMVRVHRLLKKKGLQDKIRLAMNVHDELNFYVHESVDFFKEFVPLLTPAVIMDIPGWPKIAVEWHKGYKWGSLEEYVVLDDGSLMEKSAYKSMMKSNKEGKKESKFTIQLTKMPTITEMHLIKRALSSSPGTRVISLSTPQGEVVLKENTGLSDDDLLRVQRALEKA